MTVLKETLKKHPANRDVLLALLSFSRTAGDVAAALTYAEQLAIMAPDDRSLTALVQGLRDQTAKPPAH